MNAQDGSLLTCPEIKLFFQPRARPHVSSPEAAVAHDNAWDSHSNVGYYKITGADSLGATYTYTQGWLNTVFPNFNLDVQIHRILC